MATVKGKIVEVINNKQKPVFKFALSLDEVGTETDGNGVFIFSNIPPRAEDYLLVTRSPSYKTQRFFVSVQKEGTIELPPITVIRSGIY